jgi:purine-binding chemotaxis protein CheW
MTASKSGQYLTFMLNDRPYGVPIASVREINRLVDIAPVPKTNDCIAGVINLRGKVIPVVILAKLFGFQQAPHTKNTCIIVFESAKGQAGVIVDAVSGVIELGDAPIDPAPALGVLSRFPCLFGMGKVDNGVVILVDAAGALETHVGALATELQAA